MRLVAALLLVMGASAANADLYRWIDPQTGSVKLSSVPPPGSQAGVEVIPWRGTAAPARKPASPSPDAALELRWRDLLAEISAEPPGSPTLKQRLQALVGLSAELDKADPDGAPRRHAEAQAVLQRLLKVEK